MKGNAKIVKTMLGIEDHGLLTFFLHLQADGTGQGFGGYRLDAPKDKPSITCCYCVQRILMTVGVEKWEDLTGKFVRVDGEEWGQIFGIGHITDNKWFYPEKELKVLLKLEVK